MGRGVEVVVECVYLKYDYETHSGKSKIDKEYYSAPLLELLSMVLKQLSYGDILMPSIPVKSAFWKARMRIQVITKIQERYLCLESNWCEELHAAMENLTLPSPVQ